MSSSDRSDDLKSIVEMSLAAPFIAFMGDHGQVLVQPRRGNPKRREPDIVCVDDHGELVGIEVAAAHYTHREASNLWAHLHGTPEKSTKSMRSGEDLRTTLRRGSGLVNFTDAFIANLQRTMDAHCAKRYAMPTYLLVDGRAGFLDTADRRAGRRG